MGSLITFSTLDQLAAAGNDQSSIVPPSDALLTQTQLAKFSLDNLQPPGNQYVTVDDALQVKIYFANPGDSAPLTLGGRFLGTDGKVRFIEFQFQAAAGLSQIFTTALQLTEGFLLSVNLTSTDPNAILPRGNLYAQVNLVRGSGNDRSFSQLLVQGYPSSGYLMQWPGGQNFAPCEGPGFITIGQAQAEPVPAGSNPFWSPNAFQRWRVRAVNVKLITSAAVQNRNVTCQLLDPSGFQTWRTDYMGNIPASTTKRLAWFNSAPVLQDTFDHVTAPFPPFLDMTPGHQIQLFTAGIQTGDQYSESACYVESWATPYGTVG